MIKFFKLSSVKTYFILSMMILISGCNYNQIDELKLKLDQSINENKLLKDSLDRLDYHRIINSEMILIPDEKNRDVFYGMMVNRLDSIKFNLYQTDTLDHVDGVKKKLISRNYNIAQFEIKANSDFIKGNTLYLLAEYELDSIKVKVPGILNLK